MRFLLSARYNLEEGDDDDPLSEAVVEEMRTADTMSIIRDMGIQATMNIIRNVGNQAAMNMPRKILIFIFFLFF